MGDTELVKQKADKLRLIGKKVLEYNNILVSKTSTPTDLDDITIYCDIDNTALSLFSIPGIQTILTDQTRLTIKGKGKLKELQLGSSRISSILTRIEEIILDIDTSQIKHFDYTFINLSKLNKITFKQFNTEQMRTARYMFRGCSSLKSIDTSKFNTQHLMEATSMFNACSSLTDLDLSSFDTRQLQRMNLMFNDCWSLTHLDLSSFNTPNLIDISDAFLNMRGIKDLDLSAFDFNNIQQINRILQGCSSLVNLKLPPQNKLRLNKVTKMIGVFEGCSALTHLDLRGLEGNRVETFQEVFKSCTRLRYIDLRDFNPSNLHYISNICTSAVLLNILDIRKLDLTHLYKTGSLMNTASWGLNIILKSCEQPPISLQQQNITEQDITKQQQLELVDINKLRKTFDIYNNKGLSSKPSGELDIQSNEMRSRWEQELGTNHLEEITEHIRVYSKYYINNIEIHGIVQEEPKDKEGQEVWDIGGVTSNRYYEYRQQSRLIRSIATNDIRIYRALER